MGRENETMALQDNQQTTNQLCGKQDNQQKECATKQNEKCDKNGESVWVKIAKILKGWKFYVLVLFGCFYFGFKKIGNNDIVSWISEPDFSLVTLPLVLKLFIALASFGLICLVSFYYDNDKTNTKKMRGLCLHKTGYDITCLLSWLFSADGLFSILVGAILLLIIFFICNFNNIKDNQLQLTALTLTISLSALIPSLISRIVAKNQLNDIIEDKLEKELNKFKTSLYDIRKDKGHSCRMSATLLYQNAKRSDSEEKRTNAIWSIGWAAEGIIQYLLIRDQYSNAGNRINECGERIYESYQLLDLPDGNPIKRENVISVITMYALNKYYCLGDNIGNADIRGIAKVFYLSRENESDISGASCRITGMPDDFNRDIEAEVDEIIRGFNN